MTVTNAMSAGPGTEAKMFATALGGGILLDASEVALHEDRHFETLERVLSFAAHRLLASSA